MGWKVINMKRRSSDGYVLEVSSTYEKEDTPGYARKTFFHTFEGQPSADFIPYEDLTESVVIGWVKNELGSSIVSATETKIDAEAATKKTAILNPTEINGTPWQNANDPAAGGGAIG